MIFDYRPD